MSVHTFDALPTFDSTLADINTELFKTTYLPSAIDAATLEQNGRELRQQLASLRLYDIVHDCPTYAGITILGINPLFYMPGAYVQYVRFNGTGLEADLKDL